MFGRSRKGRGEGAAKAASPRPAPDAAAAPDDGATPGPGGAEPGARPSSAARAGRSVPLASLPGGYFEALERDGRVIVTEASDRFADMVDPFSTGAGLRGRALETMLAPEGMRDLLARSRAGEGGERELQRDLGLSGGGSVAHATVAALVRPGPNGADVWSGLLLDASERERDRARIYNLAYYDTLTGLPNRRLFLERLETAATSGPRRRRFGAVAFLDLDNFKILNDTRGHDAGDALLREIAERLARCAPDTGTVARMGGDEFVLLVEEIDADEDVAGERAEGLAKLVLSAIDRPVPIPGGTHHVTGSVGYTLFEHGVARSDELLKQADMAMYAAKEAGKNAVERFDAPLMRRSERNLRLVADLDAAIEADTLDVVLQPKVDIAGRVAGAELLLRWTHPELGPIPPATFVALAEEHGLIVRLNEWVVRRAARILDRWADDSRRAALDLAVNVSAHQFAMPSFCDLIGQALPSRARRARLTLEMTERVMVDDMTRVASVMNELARMGVRLSLDDFGTGYSSFDALKSLPITELKIDGSFVREVAASPRHRVIVRAMLAMARSLDMHVVAERVEGAEELEFLLAEGCQSFQGYFFSRPVALHVFEELLALGAMDRPTDAALRA